MSGLEFETVSSQFYSPEQIRAIGQIRIGIAGAGGLGSNCAMHLVRSGFEKLIVVDDDVIEASNLNRQFYFADQVGRPKVECLRENLKRINIAISVKTYQIRLTAETMRGVFDNCQVVVEAFDGASDKAELVAAFGGSDKLVVSASGLAGYGESDRIKTRKIRKNVFVVGDGVSETGENLKPYAPRVGVAAAKMADIVLDWAVRRVGAAQS